MASNPSAERRAGLRAFGWDDRWEADLVRESLGETEIARVTTQARDRWDLHTANGAAVGRLLTRAEVLPVVGDWVVIERGSGTSDPWSILRVLERRTRISRGSAGDGCSEQVLAANVDRLWIVHGLDLPPNPRRFERYLAVAWESGASPEFILTKTDLAPDLGEAVALVHEIAVGVPVQVVSSVDPASVSVLRSTLEPGRTVALLGPSGAGKSTLLNLLADSDLAATGAVRESDRKGRHTTSHRELFQIAGGALLLDTPGIRELRVWDLDAGLDQAFPEIDEMVGRCKFRDCRHTTEPGCAILAALANRTLDPARLESYRKLQAEAAWQARKDDPLARGTAVAFHKTAMKTLKHHPKYKGSA